MTTTTISPRIVSLRLPVSQLRVGDVVLLDALYYAVLSIRRLPREERREIGLQSRSGKREWRFYSPERVLDVRRPA